MLFLEMCLDCLEQSPQRPRLHLHAQSSACFPRFYIILPCAGFFSRDRRCSVAWSGRGQSRTTILQVHRCAGTDHWQQNATTAKDTCEGRKRLGRPINIPQTLAADPVYGSKKFPIRADLGKFEGTRVGELIGVLLADEDSMRTWLERRTCT